MFIFITFVLVSLQHVWFVQIVVPFLMNFDEIIMVLSGYRMMLK